MRLLFLKDPKIPKDQYIELQRQFTDLVYEHTGITPTYFTKDLDYTNVPTEPDGDGDLKPTKKYTQKVMDDVHEDYGDWGVDHVVMLVHKDNWFSRGYWGTNWSNVYYTYHVHVCRFDSNIANALGTLYHEWMHSLDALIKTHTGTDITYALADGYDKFCVHGGRPDKEGTTRWKYIRHKENTEALVYMAPLLKQAYAKRKEMFYKPVSKIMWQIIDLLKSKLNKKNGVPRT